MRCKLKENSIHHHLMGIVLAFSPVLGIYSSGIPSLSLSQILLLILFIYAILNYKGHIKPYFGSFFIYSILISFISLLLPWIICNDIVHDIIAILFFFFILYCGLEYVSYKVLIRYIKLLGYFSVSFFIIQFVFSKFDIWIIGLIPFLPIENGGTLAGELIESHLGTRFCGFFLEPAHYATFSSLFLCITLFDYNSTSKIWTISISLITSLTILISLSASGYVMLFAIWFFWAIKILSKSVRHKWRKLIFVLITVFIAIAIFGSNNFIEVLRRTDEISGEIVDSSYGHSAYIRVSRGYIPFLENDLFHQIFGNGLGSLHSYIASHNTRFLLVTDKIPNWINGLQYILFSTGIIGVFLYIKELFSFYKGNTLTGKACIILVVLLFLSADSFYSVSQLLFVSIHQSRYAHQMAMSQSC